MGKILLLILSMLFFIQSSGSAQYLDVRLGSDALVEDAIKDAFVIVKSEYCIQDKETDQKYGRNGKPFFNIISFFGCKTDKGIILSKNAVNPWIVDNLFDKYRNSSKYKPLLDNHLIVKSLNSDSTENINSSDLTYNNDSTLICIGTGKNRIDGLSLTSDDKNAVNWIVWANTSAVQERSDTLNLEYTIIKKTVNLSNGPVIVDIPNTISSYIGGVYVCAKTINVGLVEFSLAGLIVKEDDKWVIEPIIPQTFSSDSEGGDELITSSKPINTDGELTPVIGKSNDKKKKPKVSKKK